MNKFQEYPKKMSHPQHAPAVWAQMKGTAAYEEAKAAGRVAKGGLFAPDTVCTQVERFPEVTVTTLDQEKQYAAKGYRPNNMPDPAGYEQAILDTQPTTSYKFQPYPKWKYHALEVPVIVQNELEDKALGPEWKDSPIIATEDDLVAAAPSTKSAAKETMADYAAKREAEEKAPAKKKSAATPKKAKPAIDKRRPAHREAKAA